MSSPEWSRYMHEVIGLGEPPEEIDAEVVQRMQRRYEEVLPLVDGAIAAVRRLAASFRLGLASSSNRPLIDAVLTAAGLGEIFEVTVSSEEVPRGKPAPDVFFEAARLLRVPPDACAAIEDSANGIRSARAAGMRVIAIPNAHYPPAGNALALADVVLGSLDELTTRIVGG
jgi:HAD superfamily hydrolase (TIGR01509 family)